MSAALGLSENELALRRGRITGTSAAAILGVHPFKSAHDAYREIALGEQTEMNEAMELGLLLQEPLARRWARKSGARLINGVTHVSRQHDWLAATSDYHLVDADDLLEIKTTSERNAVHWGATGTDEVSMATFVQCLVQMHVYEAPSVHVVVLIAGQLTREYRVFRDLAVEAETLAALERWHARHIVGGEEPDGTPAERLAGLEARYPRATAPIGDAPIEAVRWVEQWRSAKEAIKFATQQEGSARAELCSLLGEAEGFRGDEFEVRWRQPKPTRIVDYRAALASLDNETQRDLIERFTIERENTRRFTVKFWDRKESE